MKQGLVALACGFIFALGLGISGMTQPHKVIGFLDFLGKWDPSLLSVMVGAILTYSISYRLITRRPHPLLQQTFQLPTLKNIDRNLVLGAIIFGVGWGMAGFCPGPALASLASLTLTPFYFVMSMIAGILIYRQFAH